MTVERRIPPSWGRYFIDLAAAVAERSKDRWTRHGAVLVGPNNVVLSTGFNGPPAGADDEAIYDLGRDARRAFIVHAEQNALNYAPHARLVGCGMYVTGQPCPECMKAIAARGVATVVYGGVKSAMVDDAAWRLTQDIAARCGVRLVEFK